MHTILNQIRGIENKSYLELGIGNGRNFAAVKCGRKMSVDINGKAIFTGTTDEYFQYSADEFWDLIFIDANHDFDYVLRDFNNAVTRCREWVLIHDMIPPSIKHTDRRLCSDSYRLLYYLWKHTDLSIYTICWNYGLTFVRMPAAPVEPPAWCREVSYKQFMKLVEHMHLYSEAEIVKALNG